MAGVGGRVVAREIAPDADLLTRLSSVGILPFLREWRVTVDPKTGRESLHGRAALYVAHLLTEDPRFLQGPWHLLHADDVGEPRTEWRSTQDSVGAGSVQIVLNVADGRIYADVDRWAPHDLVGIGGHLGGEVGWPRLRRLWARLFGRRKGADDAT